MNLRTEEPAAGPWRVEYLIDIVQTAVGDSEPLRTPAILAIDGRSASGKSTLAHRVARAVSRTAIVHLDDVAWHYSVLNWVEQVAEQVIENVRRREPVSYRPPGWRKLHREGAIHVPADIDLLVIEGVGAGRRELAPLVDGSLWIQADATITEQRTAARIAADETTPSTDREWMAEEIPFLAADRPWERARLIVSGTPNESHDPASQAVVADPLE